MRVAVFIGTLTQLIFVASSVSAVELCEEINRIIEPLERVKIEDRSVPEDGISINPPLADFKMCGVVSGEDGVQLRCTYDITLPAGAEANKVVDAQDLYLQDLASIVKSCFNTSDHDFREVWGLDPGHFGAVFTSVRPEGDSIFFSIGGRSSGEPPVYEAFFDAWYHSGRENEGSKNVE